MTTFEDTCGTSRTCTTVPVNIARTDLTGLRSFAVSFKLSADLEMCAAADSAAEGTYLSAVNPATRVPSRSKNAPMEGPAGPCATCVTGSDDSITPPSWPSLSPATP